MNNPLSETATAQICAFQLIESPLFFLIFFDFFLIFIYFPTAFIAMRWSRETLRLLNGSPSEYNYFSFSDRSCQWEQMIAGIVSASQIAPSALISVRDRARFEVPQPTVVSHGHPTTPETTSEALT